MFALLMMLLGMADANYHTRAYNVTTVPAVVVTNLAAGSGFVVGTDGIARTCPDAKNVGIYLRGEYKGAPLAFSMVLNRSAQIVSTPTHGYTIACLKVE